jgi:hypothetical protein
VGLAAGVVKGIRIILWHYKVFQEFIGGFPRVFPSSLRCVAEKVLKMGYDHISFGGIVFPTLRRVVTRNESQSLLSNPTAVLLLMSDIFVA